MASNNITRAVPIMILVLILLSGAEAEATVFSPLPTMARRAGPAPPPASLVAAEGRSCPLIQVPSLVDACRSPPGLTACAAQCVVYHYRGGHCEVLPNGRLGDCTCMNGLGRQQA